MGEPTTLKRIAQSCKILKLFDKQQLSGLLIDPHLHFHRFVLSLLPEEVQKITLFTSIFSDFQNSYVAFSREYGKRRQLKIRFLMESYLSITIGLTGLKVGILNNV